MDFTQAQTAIAQAPTLTALEDLRISLLGLNGSLTLQLKELGKLPPEARKVKGAELNQQKMVLAEALAGRKAVLEAAALEHRLATERVDITLPAANLGNAGKLHPLSVAMLEIAEALAALGFVHAYGPEVETDEYNFTKLNLPLHHPARQDQDTFYLNPFSADATARYVLRTQTSNVQVRTLETTKPPFRVMGIGRVFRRDYDLTHTPQFHQVEGMMVEEGTTFAQMAGVLSEFLRRFFGQQLKTRLRPHYFPFTEPSAEVDMECLFCKGTGCKVCKNTGWLEVLGCGMVHRNVLAVGGLNPEQTPGFAFGAGVERLAMLKYGVPDLRLFYESHSQFLRQFGQSAVM
jgi:phenylalanyl-tRNA synthetase alpha chain